MGTVELDIDNLTAARTAMSGLANGIDSQRHRADTGTPVALDTLSDGSPLSRTSRWLLDQVAPFQRLIDLAKLLDVDHKGQVSYEGTGSVDETKTLLSEQLVNGLQGIGDVDSLEDRQQLSVLAEILGRYANDPTIAGPVVSELGPEGTIDALHQLRGLVQIDGAPRYYIADGLEQTEEVQTINKLQDTLAASLAIAVGSASRAGQLTDDFGKKMVEQSGDGWAIGTLFHYGDLNHVDFGKQLLVSSGEELLDREQNAGWQQWQVNQHMPIPFGADAGDDTLVDDPTLQWLKVLDNNADASQTILLDKDRAEYLLGEREAPYEDPPGDAAGDVLRAATIDQALGFDPDNLSAEQLNEALKSPEAIRAQNAALISSNTLDMFGEGAEALDGVNEEIGGIVATYIADVDRTTTRSGDGGPGTYAGRNPDQPDFLDNADIPYFGIEIDPKDLTDILEDVGGNDTARSTIAGAASRYNQVRMNDGAYHSLTGPIGDEPSWTVGIPGDPLVKAVNESAELQGFLQDSLINGAIDSAEDDAETRRKMAELFMLPTEYLPIPGGHVGDFIVGQIKEEVTNSYVGDGVNDAISDGNDQYGTARRSTQLQAYYSMLGAESDEPWSELNAGSQTRVDDAGRFALGRLRSTWPGAADGSPVAPSQLTDEQIRSVLDQGEQVPGYGGSVGTTVNTAWNSLAKQYGDN